MADKNRVAEALSLTQSIVVRGRSLRTDDLDFRPWESTVTVQVSEKDLMEMVRFSDLAAGAVSCDKPTGAHAGHVMLSIPMPYEPQDPDAEAIETFKLVLCADVKLPPTRLCAGCDAGPVYDDTPGWSEADPTLKGFGKVKYAYLTYCPACLAAAAAERDAAAAATADVDEIRKLGPLGAVAAPVDPEKVTDARD